MAVCKFCKHQFGDWRPRCPTCGGARMHPLDNGPSVVIERRVSKERRRKERPTKERRNPCGLCLRGGAKQMCDVCGNAFHRGCVSIHFCKGAA